MKIFVNVSLVALLTALLVSCVGNPSASHNISLNHTEGRGLVIVSCTEANKGEVKVGSIIPLKSGPNISFHYFADRATSKKNWPSSIQGQLYTVPLFTSGLGDFGGQPVGTVYALDLKPGDYMFAGLTVYPASGLIRPPRCFHVSPGMVTYIGNIHYIPLGEDKYQIEVKDMRDRDLPVFLKKYSNVKAEQVEFAIMQGDQGGDTTLTRGRGGFIGGMEQSFDENNYRLQYEQDKVKTNAVVPP